MPAETPSSETHRSNTPQRSEAAVVPGARPAPSVIRAIAGVAFIIILCVFASAGLKSIWAPAMLEDGRAWNTPQTDTPLPDFEYFFSAGWHLLEHGSFDDGVDRLANGQFIERGKLDWYLPFVHRWMTIFAAPGHALELEPQLRFAGLFWLSVNLIAALSIFRLLGRHLIALPPQDWPVTMLVPVLMLAGAWHWEFRLNQIDAFVLLMMTAGYVHLRTGAPRTAGLWLGLAVLLKLTPALLIVWVALKRQWQTVLVAGLTLVLAGPVGTLLAFGPTHTFAAYQKWFDGAVRDGGPRQLILQDRELDWRNQSSAAVMARWLTDASASTRIDNDPRLTHENRPPRTINVVNWSRQSVATLQSVLAGAVLLSLLLLWRKPGSKLSDEAWRVEFALVLLSMLWFMPVMRRYHVIWALPAVVVLASGLHYRGWRSAWSVSAVGAILSLFFAQAWMIYEAAVLPDDQLGQSAESRGLVLWTVLALGVPLIWQRVLAQRNPAGDARRERPARTGTA